MQGGLHQAGNHHCPDLLPRRERARHLGHVSADPEEFFVLQDGVSGAPAGARPSRTLGNTGGPGNPAKGNGHGSLVEPARCTRIARCHLLHLYHAASMQAPECVLGGSAARTSVILGIICTSMAGPKGGDLIDGARTKALVNSANGHRAALRNLRTLDQIPTQYLKSTAEKQRCRHWWPHQAARWPGPRGRVRRRPQQPWFAVSWRRGGHGRTWPE